MPAWLGWTCAALAVAGGLAFLAGTQGESAARAWQIYLVNFLYWTGLATGGVLFGLVLQVAKGHWGKPLRRLPLAFGAFLPVAYALFWVLPLGAETLFPWVHQTTTHEGFPIRTGWLNTTGVFARGGFFLGALFLLLLAFLYFEARPDLRAVSGALSGWRARLVARWTRRFRSEAEEAARSRRVLGRMSALTILFLCIVVSGMVIDLVMSLVPGWISVLFPMYFVIGAWLSALALTAILAALVHRRWTLGLEPRHFHDLGKLTFAFCVFWAYLWFSQFLPIWYGNLPRETLFVEKRWVEPWTAVSIAFVALVFVLPFLLLLGKKPKTSPPFFASVAALILVGLFVERFESVVASIWTAPTIPFGALETAVTLGFAGLFGLACLAYYTTVPPVPRTETIAIGQPRKGP
ncbi:MAG: NrfD/PsrC family molybdoenzyme membrane anchor subunit [Gemmatimonadota bacterium]